MSAYDRADESHLSRYNEGAVHEHLDKYEVDAITWCLYLFISNKMWAFGLFDSNTGTCIICAVSNVIVLYIIHTNIFIFILKWQNTIGVVSLILSGD